MRLPYLTAAAIAVAGCATPPGTPSGAGWPAPSNTKAVTTLKESARADAAAGRLTNAAASLERAIRLEPRNAELWQELARLHLKQGHYAQAEHVALRSNALAPGARPMRLENWHIIAQAREARGDAAGARAAREAAKQIGK